jgi:hypothetical protein
MNKQQLILVDACEIFFDGADENALLRMSETYNGQGSYDIDACSITFTTSKPIRAYMEKLPEVMKIFTGMGQLQATIEECKYKSAQMYLFIEDEYNAAIANGQRCEPITFVIA